MNFHVDGHNVSQSMLKYWLGQLFENWLSQISLNNWLGQLFEQLVDPAIWTTGCASYVNNWLGQLLEQLELVLVCGGYMHNWFWSAN